MSKMINLLPDIRLRFNIDHPSLEECYVYGYECALAEVGEEENPYPEWGQEHAQWSEGWWAGFYSERPLFELNEQGQVLNTDEVQTLIDMNNIEQRLRGYVPVHGLKIICVIGATVLLSYQLFGFLA